MKLRRKIDIDKLAEKIVELVEEITHEKGTISIGEIYSLNGEWENPKSAWDQIVEMCK